MCAFVTLNKKITYLLNRLVLIPVEFRRRSVGLFFGNERVLWKNG